MPREALSDNKMPNKRNCRELGGFTFPAGMTFPEGQSSIIQALLKFFIAC